MTVFLFFIKKVKKCVDFEIVLCYINGATCEKSVKLYNIKYCYYYCISYILWVCCVKLCIRVYVKNILKKCKKMC